MIVCIFSIENPKRLGLKKVSSLGFLLKESLQGVSFSSSEAKEGFLWFCGGFGYFLEYLGGLCGEDVAA